MDFQFQPLELWRASSLAQETKQVIAAYERCLASNDFDGLANLRAAIEGRIEELDAFYTAHVDDERSILFDKQRLKLRKLLHEYDEAVRSMSATAPSVQQMQQQYMSESPQAPVMDMGSMENTQGMVTRQIREDSRLSLPELLSWFTQAGSAEMPEVTVPVVEKLYANVTRTNVDGRMSIRDLRQWYISYGKRALRSGVSSFDSEVVPVALVKKEKDGGRPRRGSKDGNRTLYPWEQGEGQGVGSSAASVSGNTSGPIPLPNHMIEFQVRMSDAEFQAFSARRRQYEAELRYKERIAKGQQARAATTRDRLAGTGAEDLDAARSIFHEGRYQDPVSGSSYVFRQ